MFVCEAFRRFRRNPQLFLMGFLSIFFTQLIVNVFIVGYLELDKLGTFSGEAFSVRAYFPDNVNMAQAEEVVERLREYPEIAEVIVVSREQARLRFLEYFDLRDEDIPPEENPFPLSVEAASHRVEDVPRLAERMQETGSFDEVLYGGRNVELFLRFYQMLLSTGSVILLGVFIFSLVVITNVIRISMQSREHEIQVCSMMGATERFIRRPFLFEGFLQGILAGLGAFCVTYVIADFTLEFLISAFPFFPWVETGEILVPTLVVNTAMGGFVGFLGSLIASNAVLRRRKQ